jgi:rod shape-determining protein MreB
VQQITSAVRRTLERTPPELSADLVRTGITLAGGGALLRKMDVAIQDAIQLPVRIADDPLTCVARGTFEFLSQLHLYSPGAAERRRQLALGRFRDRLDGSTSRMARGGAE